MWEPAGGSKAAQKGNAQAESRTSKDRRRTAETAEKAARAARRSASCLLSISIFIYPSLYTKPILHLSAPAISGFCLFYTVLYLLLVYTKAISMFAWLKAYQFTVAYTSVYQSLL